MLYHWRRQPYFFFLANLYLKHDISFGVCHGWHHLHGLTRHVRSVNRELQNENSCPDWDSNPGPKCWAIRADKYRSPKGDRNLPECAIFIGSEMNFHFIRYLWNELCVLYPRAFLTHDNSEKYQWKKYVFWENSARKLHQCSTFW